MHPKPRKHPTPMANGTKPVKTPSSMKNSVKEHQTNVAIFGSVETPILPTTTVPFERASKRPR